MHNEAKGLRIEIIGACCKLGTYDVKLAGVEVQGEHYIG